LFYSSSVVKDDSKKEPIILHVHGFLGNFLQGSQRFLPPILAEAGYSSLAINTRMANFGLFFGYGIISDTVSQIDEVIKYLEELGYEKIILSGYSLGGCIVLRYASLRSDPNSFKSIKGVMALATPFSMPDSIRKRWNKWGSQPSYDEVYEESKKLIDRNPRHLEDDRTILIHKARGDTYLPEHTEIYTHRTWWHLAGPEADEAKSYMQIKNIRIPIILIQGWYDEVVDPKETYELAQVALDAGNKDVSAFYVNASHTFEGKEEELGDVIIRWLDRRMSGG
jgi:pimeloyl-ACP methyl ester carboxylesterase